MASTSDNMSDIVINAEPITKIDRDLDDIDLKESNHSVNHFRISVFVLAFVSYGLYHSSRKTLSSVKYTFIKEVTPQIPLANQTQYGLHPSNVWVKDTLFDTEDEAESFLGDLDAIFMTFYASGLYIFGWLGDRLDPRHVLSVGMVLSGLFLFLFGCVPFYVPVLMAKSYLIITYALFGLVQASGWPAEVTIISNWFGPSKRGLVLGLYASCQSIGNIVGSWIIAAIVPYGCDVSFLTMSVLMVLCGIVVFFGIISHPLHVGIEICPVPNSLIVISKDEEVPAISFWKAVLLPGVVAYALCNACLKLVNYGFFFWLPLYLSIENHWSDSKAVELSIWYDVGAVLGSITAGFLTDLLGFRSPVIVPMIFTSLGVLYGYSGLPKTSCAYCLWSYFIPADIYLNAFVMTILGALIGGSYNLIAGTVAADLGRRPELAGNAQALSTVTGLIDGTGSVGSAVGQVVISPLQSRIGLKSIFYLFIIMNFLAVLCLCKMFVQESRLLYERYRNVNSRNTLDETTALIDE